MSERKLRIKGLGTFTIDRGNEIKWHKDKDKSEILSGTIKWFSWKQDKQVSIKGNDGYFYLLRVFKDPSTRKWSYRVEREEDT